MGHLVKMNEIGGDEEILKNLEELRVHNVECEETEESESILYLTLIDENGSKKHVQITGGTWYYGEEPPEFNNLPRHKQIKVLSERIKEDNMRCEIAFILATFIAYDVSSEVYLREFNDLDTDGIVNTVQFGLLNGDSQRTEFNAWNTVLDVLGSEITQRIVEKIHSYMKEYHKVTASLEDAKHRAVKSFVVSALNEKR